jgi:type VI secretion system protein ImpF
MRSPDKPRDHFQIPVMFAFRDAFAKRDANRREDNRVDGERVISTRGSLRRRAADEIALKHDLSIDLEHLLDTVNLESVVDLDGLDYVKRSVLNYGIYDITHLTVGQTAIAGIEEDLRGALLSHEPRLDPQSISIERAELIDDDMRQRVRFRVFANMIFRPLDVPIEFVAELDVAVAKLVLPSLPG